MSGLTAAELIAERADSTKHNMGLTTWRGTSGYASHSDAHERLDR
ncbi:MAG: virulence RhuM family protein [Prevotellaceae bacterium]|nr:virulence RhuM family protein [Prevotellaceae bacterium]